MERTNPEIMSVSEFKATCLTVLERVRRTGRPLLITRHGVPIAEVFPPSALVLKRGWLGTMRGSAEIIGDLVEPAVEPGEWEALDE